MGFVYWGEAEVHFTWHGWVKSAAFALVAVVVVLHHSVLTLAARIGCAMPLTEARIRECASDDDLYELLSAELRRRLPDEEDDDLDEFVSKLRALPPGLRAMAAIYQLDVSICLDDLGWHFANWHHRPYCEETLWALRELEATEEAEIFAQAYALAQPHWDRIGGLLENGFDDFVAWYPDSDLEKATMPLTRRMWELCKTTEGHRNGLLRYWVIYARKYPHKVVHMLA